MSVRYALINPPLTDPTVPYHSIAYLVGAAMAAGYRDYSVLDANIEALEGAAGERDVADLLGDAAEFRTALECERRATRLDQLRYRAALGGVGMAPNHVTAAISMLKDPTRFYDYSAYRQSALHLQRWLRLMSLRGLPGHLEAFGNSVWGSLDFARSRDLRNQGLLDRIVRPFAGYFDSRFPRYLREGDFDLIGLSVNYMAQLPYALWMAGAIARLSPRAVLCVGGTEVSDIVKYSSTRLLFQLFAECQVAVIGEGETAFVRILRSVEQRQRIASGDGIVTRGGELPGERSSPHFEDLRTLPAPRFDVWDWRRYWSPEPVILYSPTRGCYWNRCTFCDYGLNDNAPTSPARERPIQLAIAELREASRIGRTFYFAVDALPPGYLRKLCAGIVDANLEIAWATEMRIEGGLGAGLAEELARAGCVAASFGYESGSQRILGLIDKGQRVDRIPSLLHSTKRSGITCQMMGFIGFPTETTEEALQTYQLLDRMRDSWVLAGIGDFVLTAGSIVAKNPARFGITELGYFEGDDIHRWLWWKESDGVLRYPGDRRDVPAIRHAASRIITSSEDRPFVGGIDSAHSILYFRQFGGLPFGGGAREGESAPERYSTSLPVASFVTQEDLVALHASFRARGMSAGWEEISEWLERPMPLAADLGEVEIGITADGAVAELEDWNPEHGFGLIAAD